MTTNSLNVLNFTKNNGYVIAIAQDAHTGQVLMVAHATPQAVETTLKEGLATFWSQSRNELWTKGLTSGDTLKVIQVLTDCDGDAVLYLVEPQGEGGACHKDEAFSCFNAQVQPDQSLTQPSPAPRFNNVLGQEFNFLKNRQSADPAASHTAASLAEPIARVAQKIGEEGVEVSLAMTDPDQTNQTLVSEMADLLYRLQLGCLKMKVDWSEVEAEIVRRRG